MALDYKTWLDKSGNKPTEANALIWKKTHGVALGKYNPDGSPKVSAPAPGAAPGGGDAAGGGSKPTTPYVPPAFDPNYIDPEGQMEKTALGQKFGRARLNATTNYNTWMLQNYGDGAVVDSGQKDADGGTVWNYDYSKRGGVFNKIADDERDGLRGALNSAAARGMARSGGRVLNETKVNSAAADSRNTVERSRLGEFNNMNQAIGDSRTDQSLEENRITRESNMRELDRYNRRHGMSS
jgi:hypothetical protein